MTKNNALLLIFPKRGRLIFIFSIIVACFLTIVSKSASACPIEPLNALLKTEISAPQDPPSIVFQEGFETSGLSAWKQTGDWEVSPVGKISGLLSLKHLEKPTGGTSSLFHTLKADCNTSDLEWSFTLKSGNWDPSASNRFWFYLAADTILPEIINGWAVGVNITGNTDLLELWRIRQGKADSLIIQSDMDWNASTTASIHVKRTSQGQWTLSYQKTGEPMSNVFAGKDPTVSVFTNIGLCFDYTYTRSGQLWLDDVSVNKSEAGLTIQKLTVVNSTTINLAFNKPVSPTSLQNKNFQLTDENNIQVPVLQISPHGTSGQVVEIQIGKASGVQLTLSVSGVCDLSGLPMKPESRSFAFSFSPEVGSVLLNEVLFNPLTGGVDFVELINISEVPVSIHRLKLATRNDTLALRQIYDLSTKIRYLKPNHYLTCTRDSLAVISFYSTNDPFTICSMRSFPTYADDAGTVVLLNDSMVVVDELTYTAQMHSPFLASVNGVSLERISTLKPTMERSNWASAAGSVGFATPGVSNSQATTDTQINEDILTESVIISPNGDGTNDQMIIRFNLSKAGYMANVKIFDIAGRPVNFLVKNESLARQGSWIWKGDTDSGQRLSLGVYIILVELYDSEGHSKTFKKTCTLSDRLP